MGTIHPPATLRWRLAHVTTAAVSLAAKVVISDASNDDSVVLFARNGFGMINFWGAGPGVPGSSFSPRNRKRCRGLL